MNGDGQGSRLLMTSVEAAKALAISPRTLWSLAQHGVIQVVRIGRAVRYAETDLKAYIEAHRMKSKEVLGRSFETLDSRKAD